jgi:hypothetical protein
VEILDVLGAPFARGNATRAADDSGGSQFADPPGLVGGLLGIAHLAGAILVDLEVTRSMTSGAPGRGPSKATYGSKFVHSAYRIAALGRFHIEKKRFLPGLAAD